MSNSFLNAVGITPKAMEALVNNTVFARLINRDYDKNFVFSGAKTGDTTHIRVPGFATVVEGSTAQPYGYNDTQVPVVLKQYSTSLVFTSKEAKLNIDDFAANIIAPAMSALASEIDGLGLALIPQITKFAGTPGTASTKTDFLRAKALIHKLGLAPVDQELFALLDVLAEASLVDSLTALYNPQASIAEQFKTGNMGRGLGMKFSSTQNMTFHNTGTFGTSTPVVSAGTVDGATQLVTTGWASNTSALKAGDVISYAGGYALNPVTKAVTNELKQFIVSEDCDDTSGTMTIKISPAITLTGPLANVSAVPGTSAALYVYGKQDNTYSNKVFANNIVGHKNAFVLCTADLDSVSSDPKVCSRTIDPDLKVPIRTVNWYNGQEDSKLMRIDVLVGWNILREGFACRVA